MKEHLTTRHIAASFLFAAFLFYVAVHLRGGGSTVHTLSNAMSLRLEAPSSHKAVTHRVISVASNYHPTEGHRSHQQSEVARFGLDSVRQVMVLRMCGIITPALREHITQYVKDIGESSSDLGMWILYDTGNNGEFNASYTKPLFELQSEFPHLGLFFYNWPPIERLLSNAHFLNLEPNPNWWFHDASLMLWAHTCGLFREQPFSMTRNLFLWMIEVDALFTGNVSTFLRSYAERTEDYIGWWWKADDNWAQRSKVSWEVPPGELIAKCDFVERYSARLLRFLYAQAKLNVLAFGEGFAGTICHLQDDWCTMGSLLAQHVGPHYEWNTRLTEDQVTKLMQDPTQHNKWNHAVMAYKGVGCFHS